MVIVFSGRFTERKRPMDILKAVSLFQIEISHLSSRRRPINARNERILIYMKLNQFLLDI